MRFDEAVQTSPTLQRKLQEAKVVKEQMELCRMEKKAAQERKLKEQKEVREMLANYWPWSFKTENPRGFNNMNCHDIYPQEDFEKAKRFVGLLNLGRPGGGAPMISPTGQRLIRTKEDPLLRFQWTNELRKCVDNTLRYKTTKDEQDDYRGHLDRMVAEKRLQKEREKREALEYERNLWAQSPPWGRPGPGGKLWRHPREIGLDFLKSLGWTNKDTLKQIEQEQQRYKQLVRKGYNNFKSIQVNPPNQIVKVDKIIYPTKTQNGDKSDNKMVKHVKLSPLRSGKENEEKNVDLVPLIAVKRGAQKIPLGSTDVTKGASKSSFNKPTAFDSTYLKELSAQMQHRNRMFQEMKAQEMDDYRKHINTWQGFWGRPGHGAPRSTIKKGSLDKLLYPQMVPIPAH